MRLRALWPLGLALLLASAPAMADDIYVSTTGVDDAGCGATGDPCRSIQFAIDFATAGDTIRVLAGTYLECVNSLTRAVTIHAEDTNRANTVIDASTLDCGSNPGVDGPTVQVGDGATIEGFTITGGGDSGVLGVGSVVITNNVITGNSAGYGGGIFLKSDDLTAGTDPAVISLNQIESNDAIFDGGGIFVLAEDSDGVLREVQVTDNVIQDNTAEGQFDSGTGLAGGHGGGVVLLTNTNAGGQARIVMTGNTVDDNHAEITVTDYAAYGGGLWAATVGNGTETIEISAQPAGATESTPNTITNNTSQGDGGGASIWINPSQGSTTLSHTILFDGNTVSSNDAQGGGGGGLDLYVFAWDIPSDRTLSLTASNNQVTGNTGSGDTTSDQVLGGGGILGAIYALRTNSSGMVLDVHGNDIRSNTDDFEGGGAKFLSYADADPELDGINTARSTATALFDHNLVKSNTAAETFGSAVGGGMAIGIEAFGDADALVAVSFDTITANTTDIGSGGIETTAFTDFDFNGSFDGQATLTVENSIITDNQGDIGWGYGIGGLPAAGTANFDTAGIRYNDVFGNKDTVAVLVDQYEDSIGNRTGSLGNISADPMLNLLAQPAVCSPTVDTADPAESFALEPEPNGDRANMGHLGNTPDATISVPDINGDELVDGMDILAIATTFAASSGQPRYNPAADLDVNGMIDGADLALVSAHYGTSCP